MKKVLVIDDHEGSAETMVRLLKLYGADGFACNSPNNIVDIAKEFKPNVAIVDLQLNNELSGYDVAQMLRAEFKDIFLIAHTGKVTPDIEKCKLAGFNEIVLKPTNFEHMYELIEKNTASR